MDRFEQNFAELQKVLRDRCVALKFPDNPMTKIKQGWGDWGAQAADARIQVFPHEKRLMADQPQLEC